MSARLSDERSDGSDTSDSDYDSAAPVQNATEDPATVTDTAATGKSEADGAPDATAIETAIATAVGIALVDEAQMACASSHPMRNTMLCSSLLQSHCAAAGLLPVPRLSLR